MNNLHWSVHILHEIVLYKCLAFSSESEMKGPAECWLDNGDAQDALIHELLWRPLCGRDCVRFSELLVNFFELFFSYLELWLEYF